jgi:hypothetical protein
MNEQTPDQELREKAKSIEEIEKRGSWYPLLNPLVWVERPPPSGTATIEVLMFDVANMFCVFIPAIACILFFTWALTGIRIPIFLYGFWGFAARIFLYVIHYWLIKWYPYLQKINKSFALLSVKIIPVLVGLELSSRLITASYCSAD